MTRYEADALIERVVAVAGDPEAGHMMADNVVHAILVAIASGQGDPRELAEAGLRVYAATEKRWFA